MSLDLSCNSGLMGEYAMEYRVSTARLRSTDNSLTHYICHDLRGDVDYKNICQLS